MATVRDATVLQALGVPNTREEVAGEESEGDVRAMPIQVLVFRAGLPAARCRRCTNATALLEWVAREAVRGALVQLVQPATFPGQESPGLLGRALRVRPVSNHTR
jgi:hypothetical protein